MSFAFDLTDPQLWRTLPAAQQPAWPDRGELAAVTARLQLALPLVFPAECDRLTRRLAAVANGDAFLLQAGDCAESFYATSANSAQNTVATMRQMAVVLGYALSSPVVLLARMAGQYAKPRSAPTETRGGLELPVYRGDAVNGSEFDAAARTPDPHRMLQAYHASATGLNVVRELNSGRYTSLRQLQAANERFVSTRAHHRPVSDAIGRAIAFLSATLDLPDVEPGPVFVSHEGLLLDYESALTRVDAVSGRSYATSGHLLWIGERTRAVDGAHVEFFRTLANPIAVKVGPGMTPDELSALIDRLDPDGIPGRLTLITRMGADRIRDVLPALVESVRADGRTVGWVCDPMHGNTLRAPSGHKIRRLGDIVREVKGFFEVHRAFGTHPGGIHVELTGDDVTECVGAGVSPAEVPSRYQSVCDPRLSRDQALDLAFQLAGLESGSSIERASSDLVAMPSL
ncbi:3-deoxy-7-phosphoheptulonate synthase class II [Amycolatopsis sp. EV170708-02-1]|uniref:3-deoxy-7-phosphoheptulonate synthase class II n=1 Tax=Amycolatopsis sp. EV170708-02-1 TaxID=2919322 RepID=UPI001F0C2163|nr:3-deoxy-7-phosphoheptulonate synthase class II [Amycolatopsis sp. EV170708-02-1]UMP01313.1 3-deoxy-7-phosphoheptulonate synthase [Amycolatopsis sp. EV170708-02-1]